MKMMHICPFLTFFKWNLKKKPTKTATFQQKLTWYKMSYFNDSRKLHIKKRKKQFIEQTYILPEIIEAFVLFFIKNQCWTINLSLKARCFVVLQRLNVFFIYIINFIFTLLIGIYMILIFMFNFVINWTDNLLEWMVLQDLHNILVKFGTEVQGIADSMCYIRVDPSQSLTFLSLWR